MKRVNTFVDMDTELVKESSKKAEIAKEISSKRAGDELQQKYFKKQKIFRVFNQMLKGFDKEDLETMYRLVKDRYKSTKPVGDDRLLWGNLLTIFKPSAEDKIWRGQDRCIIKRWRLYDSCGVHYFETNTVYIYMLVEKKYPLGPYTYKRMWDGKLQVDYECEMAYELFKFIKIIGIKRLLDDHRVTAAQVCVTAAKLNTASIFNVACTQLMLLVYKLRLLVFRVNAANTKLQLLKEFMLSEKG
ncbi:hypothetical protein Tco_0621663 [Tanacetum coccineum]